MTFNFQTMAEALSITDSLKVTIIGLLVVFAVLAILILFIEGMHAVFKDRKHKTDTKSAPAKQPEERISAGVVAAVPSAEEAAQDGEFIAAVSAAISLTTGKPNTSFVIKSIKNG